MSRQACAARLASSKISKPQNLIIVIIIVRTIVITVVVIRIRVPIVMMTFQVCSPRKPCSEHEQEDFTSLRLRVGFRVQGWV